jgi:hypothetical protein
VRRCALVQHAVMADPAALLLYTRLCRRSSMLVIALVAAFTAVVVAALQALSPQAWQVVRATLEGLAKK